jgi:hypothetical protein
MLLDGGIDAVVSAVFGIPMDGQVDNGDRFINSPLVELLVEIK